MLKYLVWQYKHKQPTHLGKNIFKGSFNECELFCKNKYKNSKRNNSEELIYTDLKTVCEIFEDLDNINYN